MILSNCPWTDSLPATTSPFQMLQCLLGLEFDPCAREIRLVQPMVPALAGDVTIRNLHLNDASVDFTVRQRGDAVRAQLEDVPYDSKAPLFKFGFGLSYPQRTAEVSR